MAVQVLRFGRDYPVIPRHRDRDDGADLLAAMMASMGIQQQNDREANIATLGLLLNREQGQEGLAQRESEFTRSLADEKESRLSLERQQGDQLRLMRDQFAADKDMQDRQIKLLEARYGLDSDLLKKSMTDATEDRRLMQQESVASNTAARFQSAEARENERLKLKSDIAMKRAAQQQARGAQMITPALSALAGRSQFVLNPDRTPTTEELSLFDQSTRAAITGFGSVLNTLKEGGLTTAEARGAVDTALAHVGQIVDASYTLPADRQKKLASYIKPLEEMRIKLNTIGAQLPDPNESIDSAITGAIEAGASREEKVQSILDNLREADGGTITDLRRMASGQLAGIDRASPSFDIPNVDEATLASLLSGVSSTPTTPQGGTVDATPESRSLFRIAGRGLSPLINRASEAVGGASDAAMPYVADTLTDLMSIGSADPVAAASPVKQLPQAVADPIDGTRVQNLTKADVLRWRSKGVSLDQLRAMGVPEEWLQ